MDFNNDNGALSNVAIISSTTGSVTIEGTGALTVPSGTSGQQPTLGVGQIRHNTTTGYVEVSSNGHWVNIDQGITDLDGLTDVAISNPLPTQLLSYTGAGWQNVDDPVWIEKDDTHTPTGFVELTSSKISFDETTRQFKIEPTGTEYTVWVNGRKFIKTTADIIPIANVTSGHYIYFNYGTAAIATSTTPWTLGDVVPVAYIYWNADLGKAVVFGDERHGIIMSWLTHQYLHNTVGAEYSSGLMASNFTTTGSGALDSEAQFALSSGIIYDEDLLITIESTPTPINNWEQDLGPIAKLPVVYRLGTTGNWYIDTANNFPVKMGTNFVQYNYFNGSSWVTEDLGNGNYVAMWIFGSNDVKHPVMAMVGQRYDTNIENAKTNSQANMLQYGNMAFNEFKILYRVIYKVVTSAANAVHAHIADVTDMRDYPTMATVTSIQSGNTGTVTYVSALTLGTTGTDLSSTVADPSTTPIITLNVPTASATNRGALSSADWITFNSKLSTNQTITVSGDATGSGSTSIGLTLANTTVTSGAYGSATQVPTFTVNSKGLLTAASNVTIPNTITITGDATGTGTTSSNTAVTLATVNSTVGQFGSATQVPVITVNAKGLVTSVTNVTVSGTGSGGGTVTSVSLSAPAEFVVSGSPVIDSGTLTLTKATQVAKTVYAGPTTGANAQPTFRTIALNNDLSDVTLNAPIMGQVLLYDGTKWTNFGSGGGSGAATKRIWSNNVAAQSGNTTITPGTTAPLITAGTQLWSQTLTPYSTAATYILQSNIMVSGSVNNQNLTLALFRTVGGVSTYIGGTLQIVSSGGNSATLSFAITDMPATSSPVTYSLRIGANTGIWYVNRRSGEVTFGGMQTGWVMWEY